MTAVQVTAVNIPRDNEAVIVELGAGNVTLPLQCVTSQNVTPVQQTVTTLPQSVTTMPQIVTTLPEGVTPLPQDVVMAEPESHESHHGAPKSGQFLPVEGGYILVEENGVPGKIFYNFSMYTTAATSCALRFRKTVVDEKLKIS